MDGVELYQEKNDEKLGTIVNPKIYGENRIKLQEHMLESSSKKTVDHIFFNAYKILPYLVNPDFTGEKRNKILCVGKVQSGKTAFFISCISLAFDNGYDLAYVIGGTKTKLKDQNYDRLELEFINNPNIRIVDINQKEHDDPRSLINDGYKVIVVALKNISSDKANLGVIESYSVELSDIPSIIIDDEGDECSPGAPKLKSKNNRAGRTHDVLVNIINNLEKCTLLSVTATPQANFLISTIDELSPDYAVLVEPGEGYTGGNSYHDIFDNPHVITIDDSEDFKNSIPESFKNAIYFFIFSILTSLSRNDTNEYSMLVHPSSLTRVQSMVVEKIEDFYLGIKNILLDSKKISFDTLYEEIYESGKSTVNDFDDYSSFKSKTVEYLSLTLNEIAIYEFNVSKNGRNSILTENVENKKYKIYVGGNMLGRGLTIKNLNVTYMYRDSKITQIDTLYQRARWFGYKQRYFDLCRVYMTKDLKYKFIDTVENENDMWNSLQSFMLTKTNIKEFPRLFTLKNDKLRLTRASVSKTVMIERINPGYEYDRTIYLNDTEKEENRLLYNNFYLKHFIDGEDIQFGESEFQHHFVITMKFSDFYKEFLTKYHFPKGSQFGIIGFKKMLDQINNGVTEDIIRIVLMRYRTGEYRSPISYNKGIKELPQSYDSGTKYPGDKNLPGLKDVLHIQIHPVYIDKNKQSEVIPVLALNNPITPFNIRYVTGDNYYGEI